MRTLTKNDTKTEYYIWLCSLVGAQKGYGRLSEILYDIPFNYILERDENRAYDGIELRYRYMYEHDMYDIDYIEIFDDKPCSVLEMLIALAVRIEDQFMDNLEDNRTGYWFKLMLENLGLKLYTDSYANNWSFPYEVKGIIDNFLNRSFSPDGHGSIFTTGRDVDMRDVEFWCQATWYLSDNFFNKGE